MVRRKWATPMAMLIEPGCRETPRQTWLAVVGKTVGDVVGDIDGATLVTAITTTCWMKWAGKQ